MLPYTRTELNHVCETRLKELIAEAGGPSALAKITGRHINTVTGWIKRGRISKNVLDDWDQIKSETIKLKFSPEYLRPDYECR